MSLIKINNLNKSYGKKIVLQQIDLTLEGGQIVGLLGPNGCGKSTLLKILAGLISDYQGNVMIAGEEPGITSKSLVSYLPEKTYLSGWMKPKDAFNIFSDFYQDFDRAKAEDMLSRFRINQNQAIKTMSKGMQEKLQLTLVMSRNAKIYLLDEPMGGIDPATRSSILDTTLRHYQEDAIMIFATHLIADVEAIFDRVIFLGEGKIKLDAPVDQIRQDYGKSVDGVFREVFACLGN